MPDAVRALDTDAADGPMLREQVPGQEAGAGKERNDAGHEEESSQVRVGKVEGFEIGHLMVLGIAGRGECCSSGSYRCPE